MIRFKSLNLEQVTSKYSERLYLCLNNYHFNLNSKFNNLFQSLNVIECTLGWQYIRVTLYLLQTYPSGKPLFKGQGSVNLTFKQPCFGRIKCGVYTRRSKRLNYKQLNETGEKVEKEEVEGDQIEEVSNLFRTISISEDLLSLNVEENMNKQKADALVIDKATIGEGIDDYIDENNVENMLSIQEVDEKIQQIEELRSAYKRKHNELKVLLRSNYEDSYAEDGKKRLVSVKNYIMKANRMKRDMSERKLIPDTKSIASKKRSEEVMVQEVKLQ